MTTPLQSNVLDKIGQLISSQQISDLPGNSPGASIEVHRGNLQNCLQRLRSENIWDQQQSDANNRNVAVGLQAILENVLLNLLQENKANKLIIVVHTNNPPTPLCSDSSSDMMPMMHRDISTNPACQSTVLSRRQTNNDFLACGDQVDFYSLYTHPRKNDAEQQMFEGKVIENSNLFPIHVMDTLPEELSGATYQLVDVNGDRMVIGVRITQANVASKNCSLFIGNSFNDPKLVNFIVPLKNLVAFAKLSSQSKPIEKSNFDAVKALLCV
ncbi:hypothetical protein [Serratia quinivorans]|uniref:hypothetical protein n=1 Tax=Serratia quinivorans TaxID=137545 RepID=UPI0021BD677C|nr:hypothetical protein [Serratia quinivorans]